jgi:Mg2+ and Co2+ transporter CorA
LLSWDVIWVHVTGLENQEKIREIGELFGLHLLALEDVVSLGQRPKVEEYEDNLFLVMQRPPKCGNTWKWNNWPYFWAENSW